MGLIQRWLAAGSATGWMQILVLDICSRDAYHGMASPRKWVDFGQERINANAGPREALEICVPHTCIVDMLDLDV